MLKISVIQLIFLVVFSCSSTAKVFQIPAKFHQVYRPNATPKFSATRAVHSGHLNFVNYNTIAIVGNISIGTPEDTFTMLFELSIGDSWLLNKNMTDDMPTDVTGHDKKPYVPSASTSYESCGKFRHPYGNGSFASDIFSVFDGLQPVRHSFGILDDFSQDVLYTLMRLGPMDGFLGLLPQPKTLNNVSSFVYKIGDQLDEKVYTVWQEKTKSTPKIANGEITIGALDSTHCNSTQWAFISITNADNWTLPLESIFIRDRKIDLPLDRMQVNTTASVSSIGFMMIGPTEQVNWIAKAVGAEERGGMYFTDCAKRTDKPTIVFNFSKTVSISLTPDDYILEVYPDVCQVGFFPIPHNEWIFGSRLFNSYCMARDFAKNTVGFTPSIE